MEHNQQDEIITKVSSNLAIDIKSIKEVDDHFFNFEGLGAVFDNVDQGRDRILKGAFKNILPEIKNLPAYYEHGLSESLPVGVYYHLEETDKGLFVKGRLPKDDTFVSGRLIPQMKTGSIKGLSVGFNIGEFTVNKGVRDILSIRKLHEISLTSMPMNESAIISSYKNLIKFEGWQDYSPRELERALKSGIAFSSEDAKTIVSVLKKNNLLRDEAKENHRDDEWNKILAELQNINKTLKG